MSTHRPSRQKPGHGAGRRPRRRSSLRWRLYTLLLSVAVLPVLAFATVLAMLSYHTELRDVTARQQLVATHAARWIERVIEHRLDELALIEKFVPDGRLDLTTDAIATLLARRPMFERISLTDHRGNVLTDQRRVFGQVDPRDELSPTRRSVEKAISNNERYVSQVWTDKVTGEPHLRAVVPIEDLRTGAVDRAFVAVMNVRPLWTRIAKARAPESDFVYLLDPDGRVIAHQNPSVVLRGDRHEIPTTNGLQDGLGGELVIAATASVATTGHHTIVVAERLATSALTLTLTTLLTVGAVAGLAACAVSVLGLRVVRQIVDPIEGLSNATHAVANGELETAVPVNGNDELGRLAESFNRMSTKLSTEKRRSNDANAHNAILADAIERLDESFALWDESSHLVIANGRFRDIHAPIPDADSTGRHLRGLPDGLSRRRPVSRRPRQQSDLARGTPCAAP